MEFSLDLLKDPTALAALLLPIGLKILYALVIYLIGKAIARFVANVAAKAMGRSKLDVTLVSFLSKIIYVALLAFVIIAALGQLGINTTSAAAIVGAAGLAIGLSLKDQISSFAAGVMLIMFRPFKPGDFVEAGGESGVVEEINITHTHMRTGDNKAIIIPNSAIWGDTITNYNTKPTRRIDLVVGVSYEADLKQTRSVLEGVLSQEGRLLAEPAPVIAVHELADSSVNFVVRPWVNTADYWAVRWALTEAIKNALDAAGIGIPYPQMDVHIDGNIAKQQANKA